MFVIKLPNGNLMAPESAMDADGEVVALLGRNGAGKSTTFRSIIGLVEQRSGRIVFEGRDISDQPTHAIVRGGLPSTSTLFKPLVVFIIR